MKIERIISGIGNAKRLVTNNLIDKGIYSKRSAKKLVVVMYHGIDKHQDTRFNERFFSKTNFEKHLVSFRQHFHILNYESLLNQKFSDRKPNLVLTFDDGYANNYNYALPLLDKYGVHAFFFITGLATLRQNILWADAVDMVSHFGKEGSKVSVGGYDFMLKDRSFTTDDASLSLPAYIRRSSKSGYEEKENLLDQLLSIYDIRKHKELDDYWQLMTDDMIRRTSQSKHITIGSHGFYHNNLGSLRNEDAVAEVMQSKLYLENITQKPVATIGFPDGSYTEQLNDSLHTAGFTQQYVVDYRYNEAGKRDFTYHRLGLYPSMGNTHKMVYKILHQ